MTHSYPDSTDSIKTIENYCILIYDAHQLKTSIQYENLLTPLYLFV